MNTASAMQGLDPPPEEFIILNPPPREIMSSDFI
jgi:hypothetical protein